MTAAKSRRRMPIRPEAGWYETATAPSAQAASSDPTGLSVLAPSRLLVADHNRGVTIRRPFDDNVATQWHGLVGPLREVERKV